MFRSDSGIASKSWMSIAAARLMASTSSRGPCNTAGVGSSARTIARSAGRTRSEPLTCASACGFTRAARWRRSSSSSRSASATASSTWSETLTAQPRPPPAPQPPPPPPIAGSRQPDGRGGEPRTTRPQELRQLVPAGRHAAHCRPARTPVEVTNLVLADLGSTGLENWSQEVGHRVVSDTRPSKGLDMSVWFITGASRGFGLEITKEALSRGERVVATARNPQSVLDAIPEGGDRLLSVGLDVSVPEQVSAAVDAAAERFGRIDVLVNNAGRGLVGAVEETSDAEARALFDVNVFGLLAVTRAVLPHMRD